MSTYQGWEPPDGPQRPSPEGPGGREHWPPGPPGNQQAGWEPAGSPQMAGQGQQSWPPSYQQQAGNPQAGPPSPDYAPPPRKRRTALIAAFAAVAVAVIGGATAVGVIVTHRGGKAAAPTVHGTTASPLGGLSAWQIRDKAEQALRSAGSLTISLDHMPSDSGNITGKISMDNSGHCVAHLNVPEKVPGWVDLMISGKTIIERFDTTFWQAKGAPASAAQKLGHIYMRVPASYEKQAAPFCTLNEWLRQAMGPEVMGSAITKAGTATVGGVHTVILKFPFKDETDFIYIADQDTPYPLKASSTSGQHSGTATFSAFGQPVTVHLPPKNKIYSQSQLQAIGVGQ